ncbi:hypothetical protein [Streptomyces milbemycinicus]|uniref:Gfo/Idh/MocA-like oxidoreductase N-terminal domain-containing protein n=1 Tax=Streptomyces milbemycinicus TaxID=476552 RepID=A0ABW8LIE0_9ACTN
MVPGRRGGGDDGFPTGCVRTGCVPAGRLGGGRLGSIGGLFADPGIEALVIATPAGTHADLVEAAARQGKAIYL